MIAEHERFYKAAVVSVGSKPKNLAAIKMGRYDPGKQGMVVHTMQKLRFLACQKFAQVQNWQAVYVEHHMRKMVISAHR